MDRRHLTVYDPDAPEGGARLALVLTDNGWPEYLDSDDGRFARVIRGYSGSGLVRVPVAVKFERPNLPPSVGRPKFVSEYQAQCSIHNGVGLDQQSRVVRVVQPWGVPDGMDCDELPPTLICPLSRRILPPKCVCGQILRDEDLRCPGGCLQPAAEAEADRLERVRANSGCGKCDGPCDLYWLVTRRCKLIVLELLDVDLGEYVRWRWHQHVPSPRPGWEKYRLVHEPAVRARLPGGPAADPVSLALAEFSLLLRVFLDAVRGVEELHRRHIPHLDLKPANLCLTLDGATARLKVIDLGQADDPRVPWADRAQSIADDAERRLRDPVYSAPEQLDERFKVADCVWWPTADGCKLRLPDGLSSVPLRGDWCYLNRPQVEQTFHRVVAVDPHAGTVTAWPLAPEDELPPAADWPTKGPEQPAIAVAFVQQAGKAADVFALGMVLLFLLTRGRGDLTGVRNAVPQFSRDLANLAAGPQFRGRPARLLAEELLRQHAGPLAAVARYHADTPESLREVSLELIGVALRAVCRVQGLTYTAHRGDAPADALSRMMADVMAARTRLRAVALDHELHAGWGIARRRSGLVRLRAWLANSPAYKPCSSSVRPPQYSRDRLCATFDLLGDDQARDTREFEALLDHYRRDRTLLAADLELFDMELTARMLTASRVHPVVGTVIRLLGGEVDAGGSEAGSALLAAQQQFIVPYTALTKTADKLVRLSKALHLVGDTMRLTDNTAAVLAAELDRLPELTTQITARATAVTARLGGWHDLLECPLTKWRRLDEDEAWQAFATVFQTQVDAGRVAGGLWERRAGQLAVAVPAVADLLGRLFVAPWPAARRRYRWSIRGLWRRLVCWKRGKQLRVPVAIPASEAAQFQQAIAHLLAALKQVLPLPDAHLANARPSPPRKTS